ncbi:MAG: alginate export family protein [Nitrospiraceae bacterium]|nr:alginate export family protein [Nitrospiraceae bacterium]
MRKSIAILIVAITVLVSIPAFAELQNVTVGGQIRLRGRYWKDMYAGNYAPVTRMPVTAFGKRAIGPTGVDSLFDFDGRGNSFSYIEQVVRLNVTADFTDNVSAFIELQDWYLWGEDFRSNYVTGVDFRANTADDVEVLQAYIQVDEMFGHTFRLRIGRQQLVLGKGFLIGSAISPTMPLSYDGIRITHTPLDTLTVDAFWMKLAESGPVEEDGDVDLYGVYGTYSGIEYLSISAYWLLVRDARAVADTYPGVFGNWVEDLLDLDDYDVTNVHTAGIRAFGEYNALDYDLEVAYQWGEAGSLGVLFPMASVWGVYGDDGADYSTWAGDLEIGYTFDYACQPRIFIGGAYYGGEDNRDNSFWGWLNPFEKSEASLSFNRLFSQLWYSNTFDSVLGASTLSNFWQVRAGMTAKATESITTALSVAYFEAVEPFDWPVYVTLPGLWWGPGVRFPVAPFFDFWTQEADNEIGVLTHLWVKYQYSDDLFVKVGWEHLFTGQGLEDGNFIHRNGLATMTGTDDDDTDYFYFDMGILF